MKVFAYFHESIPGDFVSDEAKADYLWSSIRDFASNVIPAQCRDVQVILECSSQSETPFAKRPHGRELLSQVHSHDFVFFRSLSVFRSHNDALESLAFLVSRRATVLLTDSRIAIEPNSPAAEILRALRAFDSLSRSYEAERRKSVARQRERPVNQFAPYGWEWIRGDDGTSHKVPCERERRIMEWLLMEKPNHTWEELYGLAKQRHFKARSGKPVSLRVLRRMHKAALELEEAGELSIPVTA